METSEVGVLIIIIIFEVVVVALEMVENLMIGVTMTLAVGDLRLTLLQIIRDNFTHHHLTINSPSKVDGILTEEVEEGMEEEEAAEADEVEEDTAITKRILVYHRCKIFFLKFSLLAIFF